MALDANRLGQSIVDKMKAANPDVFADAAQEQATLDTMTRIAEAIVEEIDTHAELNSANTGTPGVID